jgi:hypothetical protein
VIADIRLGKRPSRPTDPSQKRWLQDPVWDTIAKCWGDDPERRYKLSVVHRVFLKHGRREAQNVKPGNLDTYRDRSPAMAEGPQTLK